MTNIDETQVNKLLEDIASIKSVINDNKPLLRQLMLPIHFRIISLVAGVLIIGLSALYYFLLEQYGHYYNIPSTIRTISVGLIVIAYLGMGILKRFLWMKSVKKIDQQITFGQLAKTLYQIQLFHVWIPVCVLLVFVSIYMAMTGGQQFIVPVIAIGLGVLYNVIGSATRIKQYLITGYWMIGTGVLPLLFPTLSALICLALSVGCAMLLFFIISGTRTSKVDEE